MGRLRVWRAVDAEGEDLDVLVQSKRKKPRHCEIDAQASEEICRRSGTVGYDDLRFCGAAARDLDTSACMNAPMEEQSGGEFASANSTVGAQDAMFQERPRRTEIPLNARRRLQHLQRPAPSDFSRNAPHASHCGDERVARGRRGSLKIRAT
jgi:hypothetical protein